MKATASTNNILQNQVVDMHGSSSGAQNLYQLQLQSVTYDMNQDEYICSISDLSDNLRQTLNMACSVHVTVVLGV